MPHGKWQVANWPHMGHFYAIVLPRLGNAYTVIGVRLRRTRDADDGADASCAGPYLQCLLSWRSWRPLGCGLSGARFTRLPKTA
jgi:hypothetical protein